MTFDKVLARSNALLNLLKDEGTHSSLGLLYHSHKQVTWIVARDELDDFTTIPIEKH